MRVVAVLVLVFTAWHLFASFLWIAPVTPLRELVPGNMLSSYMIPMFGQSWSVFAPAPINGDFSLKVRAQVEQNGELVETDWVDAAQIEVHAMHTHNLFPPRASTAGLQQASALKNAWDDLAGDQQALVAEDFVQDDTAGERLSYLLTEDDPNFVGSTYYTIEHRTAAYATQVARAVWGDGVKEIQFQASRQNVIPFEQRHDPDAVRPPVQIVQTGWRVPVVLHGQSDVRFAEVFTPMYNSYEETSK
ncbi:hypothetical protein G7068_12330 [Leucobacter viscericola]|uniref:Uncharacterized protein n=2 Tax=Leucobacter viscericola TaxID=2714935 RepID=A0A6G7XJZ0_9MICO|nr:hypothetical protein G7068_12330 [Leucobacter viscericola]